MMKLLLLILLYLIPPSENGQAHRKKVFKEKQNAVYMARRLLHLMYTIHREGRARSQKINHLRFMYEESPFYEMGYLMGEIIERYKKMIGHVRRRFEWENLFIADLIRRVQTVQFLYLEIYNLERMMHEIEIKYKDNLEFKDIHLDVVDMAELAEQKEAEKYKMEGIRVKKRQQLKKLKKQRKKQMKLHKEWLVYQKPLHQTGIWPIEYGWDIGSDWQDATIPYWFG